MIYVSAFVRGLETGLTHCNPHTNTPLLCSDQTITIRLGLYTDRLKDNVRLECLKELKVREHLLILPVNNAKKKRKKKKTRSHLNL